MRLWFLTNTRLLSGRMTPIMVCISIPWITVCVLQRGVLCQLLTTHNTSIYVYIAEGEEAGSVGWTKDESVSAVKRRDMKIHHLFDSARDDARIYLVDNMVSENECAALKKNASPRLQAASVTGDSPGEKIGKSSFIPHRVFLATLYMRQNKLTKYAVIFISLPQQCQRLVRPSQLWLSPSVIFLMIPLSIYR